MIDRRGVPGWAVRQDSQLQILQALLHRPGLNRSELCARLGVSRTTVTALVHELEAAGLVVQQADDRLDRRGSVGRPPLQVSLAPHAAYAVGIDLAQHHLKAAVCDLSGAAVAITEVPVDMDSDPAAILDRAAHLADDLIEVADVDRALILGAGVGLAAPVEAARGKVHDAGLLRNWIGLDVVAELEHRLGLPVLVDNDANLGAVGEHLFGAGRGMDPLAYLRLSAGVGLGLIFGGRLFRGAEGAAGELGHEVAVPGGRLCRCGARGCLETVASPVAVAELVADGLGEPVSVSRLIELSRAGDRGALRAIGDAGTAVGETVATLVNLINPRMIAVGGELAQAGEVMLEPIRAAVQRQAIRPATARIQIVQARLGTDAEVLGAAAIQLAQAPAKLRQRLPRQAHAMA